MDFLFSSKESYHEKYSIRLGLFTSVIVLSCSKSIDAPSAIVEADEKTCACFEPMANSFKEIRDYYINNYNSWKDSKIKEEYDRLKDNIQKEKIEASRCIRNWALGQESYWYEDQLVSPDFQGVIELSNPKNCKELDLIESLVLP